MSTGWGIQDSNLQPSTNPGWGIQNSDFQARSDAAWKSHESAFNTGATSSNFTRENNVSWGRSEEPAAQSMQASTQQNGPNNNGGWGLSSLLGAVPVRQVAVGLGEYAMEQLQPLADQMGLGSKYIAMPYPGHVRGVPDGLEYLTVLDQIIVKQEMEPLEILTGVETKNKYRVFNSWQEHVYYAYEESNPVERLFFSSERSLVIHIVDNYKQEVMRVIRDFTFCKPMCGMGAECCKHQMNVTDRYGNFLGLIQMLSGCCEIKYGIFDESRQMVYEIMAPLCDCQCICNTQDVQFAIVNPYDRVQVAEIRKIWAGFMKEGYTNADTFGAFFPLDMDAKHKALLLCAIFLIDFSQYEETTERDKGLIGDLDKHKR